jgi:hypothetical protein
MLLRNRIENDPRVAPNRLVEHRGEAFGLLQPDLVGGLGLTVAVNDDHGRPLPRR